MKYVYQCAHNNYEQLIQDQRNKTKTTPTQLGIALGPLRPVFFLAFMPFPLAVSQLFHVLSVHFCLPDDITLKLILIVIKFYGFWKITGLL